MEIGAIVANQVIIIFLLIAVGFFLAKLKLLSRKGIDQFTTLLLYVVTPCVLVNAYHKEFNMEEAKKLAMAAAFAFIVHIVAILISSLVFIRKDNQLHYRVNIFSSVYSNCGFMAIPLLSTALGSRGVFYGSMYLAVFTLVYWTHGIYVCTGGDRKQISIKKVFLNPGVIGTATSMLLFLTGLEMKLPSTITSAVSSMADLNTPLAMVVLGYYLAQIKFVESLKKASIYVVSLLRLVIIPIIGIGIAKIMGLDKMLCMAVLIPAACPTATVTTLFAARFKLDAAYSAE
ncbi:MAG: AEC family transporter, partial [Bacillota bacterium]|nr:AEC family transporter [Bacillota bacterium]